MQKIQQFLKLITGHYGPFLRPMAVIFGFVIAGQLIFLAFPYLQGKIIDNLAENAPLRDSLMLVAAIFALYILINTIGYLRDYFESYHWDYEIGKYIDSNTLEKMFKFSLGQHLNENSGLRLSIVRSGTDALTNLANTIVFSILPFILQIIFTTIVLMVVSPLLGIIVAFFGAVYLAVLYRYNIDYFPKIKENRDRWNKQGKQFSETLRNIKLAKLSAKEDVVVEEFKKLFEATAKPAREMWVKYSGMSYRNYTIINVGQAVALLAGIYLVHIGAESPGKVVMLIGWMSSIFGSISNLGWVQRQAIQQMADVSKLDEMLNLPPAVVEAKNPKTLGGIRGKIEFRNVSFTYPKLKSIEDDSNGNGENGSNGSEEETSKEILRGVSFTISPGETVAIVGNSGAGKTTIVNLLLRGYDPDQGSIFIDGVDLRDIDQKSYLRFVGYVPQHVELFDHTLRYNMAFAASHEVSEGELEEI